MRESDLTKLGRWAIPGWISFLFLVFFVGIDIVFTPHCTFITPCPMLRSAINIYAGIANPGTNAQWITAVFLVLAGIPLGFVVYQAYFFFRWNSPASRDGLAGLMKGRLSDLDRITLGIQTETLWGRDAWRKEWVNSELFQRDHKDRWRYIEMLFTEAAQLVDTRFAGISVYQRHRYLHEVMHTIGASIGAAYIAFVTYAIYMAKIQHLSIPLYLTLTGLACALLFFLMNRETQEKQFWERHREKVMAGDKKMPLPTRIWKFSIYNPTTNFLFLLAVIHFIFNPFFHPFLIAWKVIGYGFLSIILFCILWIRARGVNRKNFFWHDIVFLLLIPLGVAVVIFTIVGNGVFFWNWGYITVVTIFLFITNVLFSNRQNAGDDMIALENYVLKIYLFGDQRNNTQS